MKRRNFLKLGAIATAAIALPKTLLAHKPEPVPPFRGIPYTVNNSAGNMYGPRAKAGDDYLSEGDGWLDLVQALSKECGCVHLIVVEDMFMDSEHYEIHHFGRDCVKDLGPCPREFSDAERALFVKHSAGRVALLKEFARHGGYTNFMAANA